MFVLYTYEIFIADVLSGFVPSTPSVFPKKMRLEFADFRETVRKSIKCRKCDTCLLNYGEFAESAEFVQLVHQTHQIPNQLILGDLLQLMYTFSKIRRRNAMRFLLNLRDESRKVAKFYKVVRKVRRLCKICKNPRSTLHN